jgi:hypothetical protein
MQIADAVTDPWGVEEVPDDGTVVWFTVATTRVD